MQLSLITETPTSQNRIGDEGTTTPGAEDDRQRPEPEGLPATTAKGEASEPQGAARWPAQGGAKPARAERSAEGRTTRVQNYEQNDLLLHSPSAGG